MMKFQNKFKDHDLSQEQNARLDNLRGKMLLMGITIIEHDLFVGNAISTEEPDLAMFWYKKKTKSYLWKLWPQKVGLKHSILMIFCRITIMIFV